MRIYLLCLLALSSLTPLVAAEPGTPPTAKPKPEASADADKFTFKFPDGTTAAQKAGVRLDLRQVNDMEVAALRTKEFLTKLGYKPTFPTDDPTDGMWIKDNGIGITVRAIPDPEGADRLVISNGMQGKGSATLRSLAALRALNELNATNNVACFSLTEEGHLEVSTTLTFCDTLDARLFREHLDLLLGFSAHFMNTQEPAVAKARELLVR